MIDRRQLLAGAGALAGHAAVGGPRGSGSRDEQDMPPESLDVDRLLAHGGVADIAGAIARHEVTASEVVGAAARRMHRLDGIFGAVIEMNPDAAGIARELDREVTRGELRGPLHGVPVLLKDAIATGDRMRTTAGSLALAENRVVEDASLVKRLRDAGAVILGKTNMTEWSNIRDFPQTAGWSDRGGQTRNPYDPAMSPWGSSSGSAAAVALGYAPVALGVETNGSITCPAAACGVVGLKPTVGLVSRVGVMPVMWTLDSPGPMARTVADIAAVMNVLAHDDPDDPAHGEFGWAAPVASVQGRGAGRFADIDYTTALDPDALQGARLGVCWQLWGMDADADAVGWEVVERLRAAGAEIVEDAWIPTLEELNVEPGIGAILNAEFSAGMAAFLDRFMPAGPIRSIADVVAWNEAHADVVFAHGWHAGLVEAVNAMPVDDPYYLWMVEWLVTKARDEGVDVALDAHGLDAIIAPTAPVPTEIVIGGGTDFAGSSTLPPSFAGYPSITVPMGYVRGLPVGLHLFGRAFSEWSLIRLAYAIEQLLDVRMPPALPLPDGVPGPLR